MRYKEHIPRSISNVERSTFAEHLSVKDHNIKSIKENLDIIHKCKKSRKLDTLERFEIYKATKENYNLVLNEKSKHKNNILFNRINDIERELSCNRLIGSIEGQVGVD